jgi:curved DNA-binding protein CbpA
MTFYETLGVSQTSTPEDIKKAYRILAKKWHPDHNPTRVKEATEKFQAINEAYHALIKHKPQQSTPNPDEIYSRQGEWQQQQQQKSSQEYYDFLQGQQGYRYYESPADYGRRNAQFTDWYIQQQQRAQAEWNLNYQRDFAQRNREVEQKIRNAHLETLVKKENMKKNIYAVLYFLLFCCMVFTFIKFA